MVDKLVGSEKLAERFPSLAVKQSLQIFRVLFLCMIFYSFINPFKASWIAFLDNKNKYIGYPFSRTVALFIEVDGRD